MSYDISVMIRSHVQVIIYNLMMSNYVKNLSCFGTNCFFTLLKYDYNKIDFKNEHINYINLNKIMQNCKIKYKFNLNLTINKILKYIF